MVEMNDIGRYVLLASCPLQKGIAARLTQFVYDMGSEIIDYDQYVDIANHHFFCRMEWDAPSRTMQHNEVLTRFQAEIVAPFDLSWDLRLNDRPQRLAVFVTRELAHLYMLIMKCISGQWNASIELIISNHPDLSPEAARFGIPYHHLPVDKHNKGEQEQRQLALLKDHQVDLVILARYMQVVSDQIIRPYENRIINIHHSMLPSFSGAKPYHQAHARGVKLIGATSHYVTEDLDEGPIITQEVRAVDHRKSVDELITMGRDLEANALARAVGLHIHSRIIVNNDRTIIFD